MVQLSNANKGPNITLTNGNLTATLGAGGGGAGEVVLADVGTNTGKWYFKVTRITGNVGLGLCTATISLTANRPGYSSNTTKAICHMPRETFLFSIGHFQWYGGAENIWINQAYGESTLFAFDQDATKQWICASSPNSDLLGWTYHNGIPLGDPSFLTGYDYGGDITDSSTVYAFIYLQDVGASATIDFAPSALSNCSTPVGFDAYNNISGGGGTLARSWGQIY